jgi:hypothetical protein
MFMREAETRYQRNEAEKTAARARHLATQLEQLNKIKSEIDVTACREAHIEYYAEYGRFRVFSEGPCVAKIPFTFECNDTLIWNNKAGSGNYSEEPGTIEKEFAKRSPHFSFVCHGKDDFSLSLQASHFQ